MITVYTAPWVLPIESPPLQSGAIAVNNDTITDVGERNFILEKYKNAIVDHRNGILIPPLVNCHTHLELSHIKEITQPPSGSPMSSWIEDLLNRRLNDDSSEDIVIDEIKRMVEYQFSSGVGLLLNIGNIKEYLFKQVSLPEVHSIYEVLAPTALRTTAVLDEIKELPQKLAVAPHAVYSSSARLITSLKERARRNNHIFSVHLAESADENTLVQSQNGPFRKFLEGRDSWDNTLVPGGPFNSVIEYLANLEVLDEQTLCIHCTAVSDRDIAILKARKVKICCCPVSNKFLGVGTAPIFKFLEAGLLPCIGTDSRASNVTVNMWHEMQLMRQMDENVEPSDILKMATLGGAEALHRSNDYGSLVEGKKAQMLEIHFENPSSLTANEIVDRLTREGQPERLNWVLPAAIQ